MLACVFCSAFVCSGVLWRESEMVSQESIHDIELISKWQTNKYLWSLIYVSCDGFSFPGANKRNAFSVSCWIREKGHLHLSPATVKKQILRQGVGEGLRECRSVGKGAIHVNSSGWKLAEPSGQIFSLILRMNWSFSESLGSRKSGHYQQEIRDLLCLKALSKAMSPVPPRMMVSPGCCVDRGVRDKSWARVIFY